LTVAIVIAVIVLVAAVLLFVMRKPALPQIEEEPQLAQPKPVPPARGRSEAAEQPRAQQKPEAPAARRAPQDLRDTKPDRSPPLPAGAARTPGTPREDKPMAGAPAEEELARESALPVSVEVVVPPAPPPARRKKDVAGLRKGLTKMRESGGFFGRLRELFVGKKEIDPKLVEEIEAILLTSDVGAKTTEALLAEIKEALAKKELADSDRVWAALRSRAKELLDLPGGGALRDHGKPTVVLMVGVNGTGKTTTIGKLATKLTEQGKRVLLVAGDTFRAAAVQQLQAWGKRTGCEVFASKEGADPASVLFDALTRAVESEYDVVLCDTAGRLHTKSNLMDELKKIHRTAEKALAGAPHDTLLVVDGTTGQNAVQQAQEFGEALTLTGIVLTKLDGTAKGGVVLAIAAEHQLPVRYVGVGERAQDLRDFDADEFVEALLGQNDDAARAA
jgi:fused signal recognition particle receptor